MRLKRGDVIEFKRYGMIDRKAYAHWDSRGQFFHVEGTTFSNVPPFYALTRKMALWRLHYLMHEVSASDGSWSSFDELTHICEQLIADGSWR